MIAWCCNLLVSTAHGAFVLARGTRVVTRGQAYRVDDTVWIDVQVANSRVIGWVRRVDGVADNERVLSACVRCADSVEQQHTYGTSFNDISTRYGPWGSTII
jgi:hypothetical protein